MSITIIIGGQYGSEGKGKVTHFFMHEQNASCVVRVGGPNSGHTIYRSGTKQILQQIPVSAFNKTVYSVISAGSYIDIEIIKEEIKRTGSTPKNLIIDPYACVMHPANKVWDNDLVEIIGSTGSGVGDTLIDRITRDLSTTSFEFAKDNEYLSPFIKNTKIFLRGELTQGKRIIIEGTQGYGLSVLHSTEYPFVTARDTTAAGFLSEVGLSPMDVDDVILVIRRYPIRVAGNSGPMKNEITWEEVSKRAGKSIIEYTSVTGKVRRVAEFDPEIVRSAIIANNPTWVVLNHTDYDEGGFNPSVIEDIETSIGRKIDYIGANPYDITEY